MEATIGRITHYYDHLNVAVLKLNEGLKVGDRIHILGHSTDFIETVTSMEVNHHAVVAVEPGADVAIKVIEPVRKHDLVLHVVEENVGHQPT